MTFDAFDTVTIQTSRTSVFARWGGSGPPVLLLHRFPQTHLMWRPVLALWSADGPLGTWYAGAGGPLGVWRRWADDVRGDAIPAGHFFPEERPDQTAERLRQFLSSGK
jgi:pimeloyl-ACP methyl ester carboxylesterase